MDEIESVFKCWKDNQESDIHGNWERMRLHAVMVMQPHCKKRLTPEKLLPFPWEKVSEPKKKDPVKVDKVAAKKRMEEIVKKA